jgi:hypothetical protein
MSRVAEGIEPKRSDRNDRDERENVVYRSRAASRAFLSQWSKSKSRRTMAARAEGIAVQEQGRKQYQIDYGFGGAFRATRGGWRCPPRRTHERGGVVAVKSSFLAATREGVNRELITCVG